MWDLSSRAQRRDHGERDYSVCEVFLSESEEKESSGRVTAPVGASFVVVLSVGTSGVHV